MKLWAVISVSRQIDGEYCFIRAEKAFKDEAQGALYLSKKKSELISFDGKPKIFKISTPSGEAECMMEIGIFELEIEDE